MRYKLGFGELRNLSKKGQWNTGHFRVEQVVYIYFVITLLLALAIQYKVFLWIRFCHDPDPDQKKQCFGSGFRGLLDPDPYSEYVSGSKGLKKVKNVT